MRPWITLLEHETSKIATGSAPGLWFHGTPHAFDAFDAEFDMQHETPAIFLTNDPALAEAYASRERQPMADGLSWGEMRQDFVDPVARLIATSHEPVSAYLSREAERVINGTLDFDTVCDALPDIAAALRRIKAKFDARVQAAVTTEGANIRPCTLLGSFMHVHFLRDFNAATYDLCLRQAKAADLSGVIFHNIVDSPSGNGPDADVAAVFHNNSIQPRFGLMRDLAARDR